MLQGMFYTNNAKICFLPGICVSDSFSNEILQKIIFYSNICFFKYHNLCNKLKRLSLQWYSGSGIQNPFAVPRNSDPNQF